MLYSRAGHYPPHQPLIYAEGFSPNTPEGACSLCHGLGRIIDVTEKSMVPDDSLTIRERAIAAWPVAWQGQNLKDILTTLGYDIDIPWKKLSKKQRDWILFTEETPSVPVYAGFTLNEVKKALKKKMDPSYYGNYISARNYVLSTFSSSQSEMMKKRVARYMVNSVCPDCKGKKLKKESLSVIFSGLNIAELYELPLKKLYDLILPYSQGTAADLKKQKIKHPEQVLAIKRITEDLIGRMEVLLDLGLGHLALERSTPTLSPGELQRLRLATQVRSNLFGVVYVLDEPSAGLHPSDTEALMRAFYKLKEAGNSLFIVEHEMEIINKADWIVDVGPFGGEHGGEILYSGPPAGLRKISKSQTSKYLFQQNSLAFTKKRKPTHWLGLAQLSRNNLLNVEVKIPLEVMTSVTGISGSGKSTLVSQLIVELVTSALGQERSIPEDRDELNLDTQTSITVSGKITHGLEKIKKLVQVDQKAIGRTPRSNLATYTGLFDHVRKLFSKTAAARKKRFNASRFSFNLPQGRCENCLGEGFVMVELLFLPSVYSPCPVCEGSRYNKATLEVNYKNKNISEVLHLTVDDACIFFREEPALCHGLEVLKEVGLGYLRLGQPATELSGGEAQRIKLATELQRLTSGGTLYILDEPTTGLHPYDVEKLMLQLQKLVNAGNTVVMVEHDMQVIAESDWIIDIGPGAGDEGGKIIATGTPEDIIRNHRSLTAKYLEKYLKKTV